MKILKSLALVLLAVLSITVLKAADIKPLKATFEDYIPLLENAGYHVYSFDIESLADKKYRLTFSCREYEGDSLVNKDIIGFKASTRNMSLLSEFPEEDQRSITPEEMYDSSRGIYSCAEKIVVGTYVKNDSTTVLVVDVENRYSFSVYLHLKPVRNPEMDKNLYIYNTKPFKLGEVKPGEFIPLVMYGSAWFDPKYKVIRFCGEDVLSPDMSSRIIKDIPYSYVIGVEITEEK